MAKRKTTADDHHFVIIKSNGRCYRGPDFDTHDLAMEYSKCCDEVVAVVHHVTGVVAWYMDGESIVFPAEPGPYRKGMYCVVHARRRERSRDSEIVMKVGEYVIDYLLEYYHHENHVFIPKFPCPICGIAVMDRGFPTCLGGRICKYCDDQFTRQPIGLSPLPSMNERRYWCAFRCLHRTSDGQVFDYPVTVLPSGRMKQSKSSAA